MNEPVQIRLSNLSAGGDLQLLFAVTNPQSNREGDFRAFDRDAFEPDRTRLADLPDGLQAEPVAEEVGARLYGLLDAHEYLSTAIDFALGAPADGLRAIQLHLPDMNRQVAEALPWEVVRHPNGHFLGLEDLCPVSRIVRARDAGDPSSSTEDTLYGPVRLTAVLGAQDRPSSLELESLMAAVGTWPIDCEVSVFLDDDALSARVDEWNANRRDNLQPGQASVRIHADTTPSTATELISKISASRPHLLHILAHGTTEAGGQLDIATRTSRNGGNTIRIGARHLYRAASSAWLVNLSACDTAGTSDTSASLASALLAEGVKAVIAMREPIRYHTAAKFTRPLLVEIGSYLHGQLSFGEKKELHWGPVVARARLELCAQRVDHAVRCKDWTLPALYLQPVPIYVSRAEQTNFSQDNMDRDHGEITELTRRVEEFRALRPDIVPAIEARIAALRNETMGR